jgi:hypothetical protein
MLLHMVLESSDQRNVLGLHMATRLAGINTARNHLIA